MRVEVEGGRGSKAVSSPGSLAPGSAAHRPMPCRVGRRGGSMGCSLR